jgi:hypothetical protein
MRGELFLEHVLDQPVEVLEPVTDRTGLRVDSESPLAISRQPSHISIARRRCATAAAGSPARLSQHAVL